MKSRDLALWTFLLACLAWLPPGAAGQGSHQHGTQYPALDRMHDVAISVVASSTGGQFPALLKEAARAHGRVANMRSVDDVRRFDCLTDQSALLYGTGDVAGARRFMVSAAEHARATGDVLNAATAFVDAAILAKEAGDGAAATDFAHQARLLTYSPHLTAEERTMILERIGNAGS